MLLTSETLSNPTDKKPILPRRLNTIDAYNNLKKYTWTQYIWFVKWTSRSRCCGKWTGLWAGRDADFWKWIAALEKFQILQLWNWTPDHYHIFPSFTFGLIGLDSSEKDEDGKENVTVQEEAPRTLFISTQTNCQHCFRHTHDSVLKSMGKEMLLYFPRV